MISASHLTGNLGIGGSGTGSVKLDRLFLACSLWSQDEGYRRMPADRQRGEAASCCLTAALVGQEKLSRRHQQKFPQFPLATAGFQYLPQLQGMLGKPA